MLIHILILYLIRLYFALTLKYCNIKMDNRHNMG